jgi:predicted MFS family arabinose efflux permease
VWGAAPGVWIATVWLSVGMSLLFPALFSATITAVPAEERGQAVGTFSLFFDLATGVGAPLLGVVVSLASYRASFAVAGVCSLLGLIVIARLAARLRAAPAAA